MKSHISVSFEISVLEGIEREARLSNKKKSFIVNYACKLYLASKLSGQQELTKTCDDCKAVYAIVLGECPGCKNKKALEEQVALAASRHSEFQKYKDELAGIDRDLIIANENFSQGVEAEPGVVEGLLERRKELDKLLKE